MSSSAGDSPPLQVSDVLADLERTIEAAARGLSELTARVESAERRARELEDLVGRFTGDAGEAGRLLTRLGTLDDENTDLRARLEAGRAGVDKVLARIRFLEDQR